MRYKTLLPKLANEYYDFLTEEEDGARVIRSPINMERVILTAMLMTLPEDRLKAIDTAAAEIFERIRSSN